jgi:hypothetical protein
MGGVTTIEHGDGGTAEIFKTDETKRCGALPDPCCWRRCFAIQRLEEGYQPEHPRIAEKKKSFAAALKAGVTICMGGDAGVYAHGDNAREMELMVDYGMKPVDVLKSANVC